MELLHFECKRPEGAHPLPSGMKKLRPKEGDLPERTVLAGWPRTQVTCLKWRHFPNVSLYSRAVVLKIEHASESPEGLLIKNTPQSAPPWASESVETGCGLGMCMSNQLLGNTNTGLGTLFCNPLTQELGVWVLESNTAEFQLYFYQLEDPWKSHPNSLDLSFWHLSYKG